VEDGVVEADVVAVRIRLAADDFFQLDGVTEGINGAGNGVQPVTEHLSPRRSVSVLHPGDDKEGEILVALTRRVPRRLG
jgi:hypothetical protein